MIYPEQNEIFTIIAKTTFRQFDDMDWCCFAGCESADPMIGEYGELIVVIDGDNVNLVHAEDEYGGVLYSLKQMA